MDGTRHNRPLIQSSQNQTKRAEIPTRSMKTFSVEPINFWRDKMSNKRRKKSVFDPEPKRRPRPERRKRPRRKRVGYATQTMREAWTP